MIDRLAWFIFDRPPLPFQNWALGRVIRSQLAAGDLW